MRLLIKTLVTILFLAFPLFAQSGLERTESEPVGDIIGDARIDNKFSLFDLSRIEMSHSYTVSYFSSNGSGTTIGMYMNTLRYRISNPLTLNVQVAWIHQPGALLNNDRGTSTDYGSILPSFTLEYRPSEKFYFEIGYHSLPAYMYYGPYRMSRSSLYNRLYNSW